MSTRQFEIHFETEFQCFANSTIKYTDLEDTKYDLVVLCAFVSSSILTALILILGLNQKFARIGRKSSLPDLSKFLDTKTEAIEQCSFVNVKKRPLSCPVLSSGFHNPKNPTTLDSKELQEIVDNDYIHNTEDALDYGYGGYMPISLGQIFGPDNRYQIIRKLGWGHFSTVWLAEDLIEATRTYFAIKICKAQTAYRTVALDEINILRYVKHQDPTHIGYKHIVILQDYFNEISMNGHHMCMSLEIMGPSLLDLIILSNYQGLDQVAAKNIIKQILLGLTYLHQVCHVIHTDIKPENILVKVSDTYIHNMVQYVNRFRELGVQMPKSYVSTSHWSDDVDLYDQAGCSKTSPDIYIRDKSLPGDKYANKLGVPTERQTQIGGKPCRPLLLNANTKIKIADLGNACPEDNHYAEIIQTIQYRALEVIIDSDYSYSADLWSVACVAFEISTGEYLFNPQRTHTLSSSEDHLGLIWEVLDGIPKYIALSGRQSKKYFDSNGFLRKIKPENMKIWKVEDVLVDKYGWKRVDAIIFADFIQSLIEPDKELRATATVALTKDWLREVDDH